MKNNVAEYEELVKVVALTLILLPLLFFFLSIFWDSAFSNDLFLGLHASLGQCLLLCGYMNLDI